jgi:hypothetical protein
LTASQFPADAGAPAQDLIPVPGEVVALLRLPISVDSLASLVGALQSSFGEKDLVIRTDLRTTDGWLPVARPDPASQDSEAVR